MSTTGEDYQAFDDAYEEGPGNAFEDMGNEILDAQILPGNSEKSKLLSMFNDLRTEATFCDVAFLCKGKLFRAHRIVVSGWSRWLRALLSEGNTEEVVHLDVFEPDSFSAILDYMYGASVTVTVDSAEALLKVIRRLELHGLEQSIWIFLMKAIDANNCNRLHELADRYDCPPLKLAAWRFIQQAISGPTKHIDLSKKSTYKGTGLTGPGEPSFYRNVTLQERADEERQMNERVAEMEGIISAHMTSRGPDADLGDEEDKQQDDEDENASVDLNVSVDRNLDASSFVKAWSKRLNSVYDDCMEVNDADGSQAETMMSNTQRSILLGSKARHGSASAIRTPVESAVGPAQAPALSPTRRPVGSGSGKQTKASAGDIDWHSELKGFYLGINLPEKLPFLDEILQANAGQEEHMLSHLMMRYKRVIPQSLANHLDTLQGFLETHAEF